jgi:hypothetical protein
VPALSAPLLGFALGAGLFWSVAKELARPIRPIAGQAVLIAAVLGLFAYAPAVALMISAEPDWAYAYLVVAEQLPRWLSPCLVLTAGVCVPLGFAAALRACRGRAKFVQVWFWAPLVLGSLPVALAFRRLAVQATYEQYQGDFGVQQLVGGPFGYLLGWLFLALAGATWLARRCLDFLALGGADGS